MQYEKEEEEGEEKEDGMEEEEDEDEDEKECSMTHFLLQPIETDSMRHHNFLPLSLDPVGSL